ncbi:MAG: protein adenylyltransferase SelO [Cytophagaceae bacterium]
MNLHNKLYKKEFVQAFPGDESGDLRPRQTPGVLYSKVVPSPVSAPELLGWSEALAEELGVSKPVKEDVDVLAGNLITPTMKPYAACYAGHQFGHWAGQLGDGRAMTLGEWEAPDGNLWELQLKGAGPTPYSRRADGRAVLRSSVREYLMSEAMHHLGVPTTRALGLVTTGEKVLRDMFYDGHAEFEPGAVVMRVAPSFLRFGNFEMLAAREELDSLRKLVDWTIQHYYPGLRQTREEGEEGCRLVYGEQRTIPKGDECILAWFEQVMDRTATMVAEWLRVGFVHGVMNTDNMSILGLTIDYGPYSFLDNYDPDFTPNTTDLPGKRYAFGKQASIAYWNLGCLAGAIAPLLSDTKELVAVLETYEDVFWRKYYLMMGDKLGFDEVFAADIDLITDFEKMLSHLQPDMTIFYQLLMELPQEEKEWPAYLAESFYKELQEAEKQELTSMLRRYRERISQNSCSPEESRERMRKANPRFILRNYLLHQAIEDLDKGNNELFLKLQEAIKDPYSAKHDEFFVKRPDWAGEKAGCSMLSCSS